MKIQNLIGGLAQARPDNPLGQDSLMPYWSFFWAQVARESLSAHDRIRIFLLHVYILYFNHKSEKGAVFMASDWPEWMVKIARRHTRETIGLYRVRDSKAASALVAQEGLTNIGWFTDAGFLGSLDTNRPVKCQSPRGAAHLMLFPCPALADFGDRIQILPPDAGGAAANLWNVAPYGMMIGFIE